MDVHGVAQRLMFGSAGWMSTVFARRRCGRAGGYPGITELVGGGCAMHRAGIQHGGRDASDTQTAR